MGAASVACALSGAHVIATDVSPTRHYLLWYYLLWPCLLWLYLLWLYLLYLLTILTMAAPTMDVPLPSRALVEANAALNGAAVRTPRFLPASIGIA